MRKSPAHPTGFGSADSVAPEGLPRPPQLSSSLKAALSDPDIHSSLKNAIPKRSYDSPNSPTLNSRLRYEKLVKKFVSFIPLI